MLQNVNFIPVFFIRHLSEDVLCGLLENIQQNEDGFSRSQLLHHLHVLQEAAKSLSIKPWVHSISYYFDMLINISLCLCALEDFLAVACEVCDGNCGLII